MIKYEDFLAVQKDIDDICTRFKVAHLKAILYKLSLTGWIRFEYSDVTINKAHTDTVQPYCDGSL